MSQRVDFVYRVFLPAESPRSKMHRIERLDDVGFAMFIKMHHALIDSHTEMTLHSWSARGRQLRLAAPGFDGDPRGSRIRRRSAARSLQLQPRRQRRPQPDGGLLLPRQPSRGMNPASPQLDAATLNLTLLSYAGSS